MKIPSIKALIPENFSGQMPWIKALITPINSFMLQLTEGLNNQLTISENMNAEVKVVKTEGIYPITLKWSRSQKPTIGIMGNIQRVDGAAVSLAGGVTPIWKFTQNSEIEISDFAGLSADSANQYNITIVFYVN